MSIVDSATAAFLIGALFVFLIAFFIAGMGVLRVAEFLSPRFSRWLDTLDSERRGF